jgi:hypothetical protein
MMYSDEQTLMDNITNAVDTLTSTERHLNFKIIDLERELTDTLDKHHLEEQSLRERIDQMFNEISQMKE